MKFQDFNSSGVLTFNQIVYDNLNFCAHFHRNIEFVYVSDGEVEITVNGITLTAQKGDFAVVLPYHIHSFETKTSSKTVVGVFSNDFVSKFLSDVNHKTTPSFVFSADESVAHDFCNVKNMNTFKIMGTLYMICGFFFQQAEFIGYENDFNISLKRILRYIDDNLSDDITLCSVAENLGYEKHYVSKIFNSGVKMNFRSFINMCRVENARELLESTEKSISQIALECGFSEIRTFNRAFREYSSCSPNEYRKNQRQVSTYLNLEKYVTQN